MRNNARLVTDLPDSPAPPPLPLLRAPAAPSPRAARSGRAGPAPRPRRPLPPRQRKPLPPRPRRPLPVQERRAAPALQRSRSRHRAAVAAIALAIPLIPIAIGLMLGAGSTATAGAAARARLRYSPIVSTLTPAPPNLLLPAGSGAVVAAILHPAGLRSSPGGRVFARLTTRTNFGSAQSVWVVKLSGPWLGVITPQAGNNRVGWIPARDALLIRVHWKLTVSLAARMLTVIHNGRTVARFVVAIGKPTAPTPTGRFDVTDRLNTGDPGGPYGCCILALSAQAPHAIQGWYGGNRIAIHSTPETSSIGQAVSHGCMRLTLPEGRWLLDHIPIGTPAIISSA